jgi:hypothetical protein
LLKHFGLCIVVHYPWCSTFLFLSCFHLVFSILLLIISILNLILIVLNITFTVGKVKEGGSY